MFILLKSLLFPKSDSIQSRATCLLVEFLKGNNDMDSPCHKLFHIYILIFPCIFLAWFFQSSLRLMGGKWWLKEYFQREYDDLSKLNGDGKNKLLYCCPTVYNFHLAICILFYCLYCPSPTQLLWWLCMCKCILSTIGPILPSIFLEKQKKEYNFCMKL